MARIPVLSLSVACSVAAGLLPAQAPLCGWGGHCFDTTAMAEHTFVEVEAGLARRADGTLVRWGEHGAPLPPSLPPGVTFAQIAGSTAFAAALCSDGSIVAWGRNWSGECNVPALPPGLHYTAVRTGTAHCVALRSDGSAVAWGYNAFGECNVPALPPGLAYVEASAGTYFTLLRRSDGSVVGIGYNPQGQTQLPALPPGLGYVAISAGFDHALALRSDGAVVSCGSNSAGQRQVPAAPTGTRYVAVAAQGQCSLGLLSDGTVRACGTAATQPVPALPTGVTYTGLAHWELAALRSDGAVVQWEGGGNLYPPAPVAGATYAGITGDWPLELLLCSDGALLGHGRWSSPGQGPTLPAGTAWTQVVGCNQHFLGRRSDGAVLAWGDDTFGQCQVPALPPGTVYVDVAVGRNHSLALRSDGAVLACGDGAAGQLAVPALPPGVRCIGVAAGWDTSALLRSDGGVSVFGDVAAGQGAVPPWSPGQDYVEVVVGNRNAAARRRDGTVVVWGDNAAAQQAVPALPGGVVYCQLALVDRSLLARRSDGEVVAWGELGGHVADGFGGVGDVPVLPAGHSWAELRAFATMFFGTTTGPVRVTARPGRTSRHVVDGAGCAGTLPAARLVPSDTPRIGEPLRLTLLDLPGPGAILLTGFSAAQSALGPLPLDLAPLGLPGCALRTSIDDWTFVAATAGVGTATLAIPRLPALVGTVFHQQAIVLDAAAGNPLGAVLSAKSAAVIGD